MISYYGETCIYRCIYCINPITRSLHPTHSSWWNFCKEK